MSPFKPGTCFKLQVNAVFVCISLSRICIRESNTEICPVKAAAFNKQAVIIIKVSVNYPYAGLPISEQPIAFILKKIQESRSLLNIAAHDPGQRPIYLIHVRIKYFRLSQ